MRYLTFEAGPQYRQCFYLIAIYFQLRSTHVTTPLRFDQVRGFCVDKSNPELFDDVNVYGNIYDSDIHHNNFGVYTYGHQQGDWRRNKMHDNSGYGFDPHDDSDFLTIHDNVVYNNGYHGIIASKRCNGVSIQVQFVENAAVSRE